MKDAQSIVHVVDSLERGGLERLVTDLAIEQHRAGDSVAVFSINETQGFAPLLREAGVPVVSGHKQSGFDLGVISALRRLVVDQGACIVHAHNFVPNYYAAAALLGLGRKVKLIGTCHDMGTRLVNRRLRLFYRLSLLRTARVAMVGQQVHRRFVGDGIVASHKADTVLNAVPLERFAAVSSASRLAARDALGLPHDALLLGCVGRLVSLKNHRLMIDLMPKVLAVHSHACLVLLGGGVLEPELRAQVQALGLQGKVILAGERPQVSDLLPAFDVFVLPSLTEGVSIALLEACATGLAVVATDVGGNPEIIQQDLTGLLVPPDHAQATLAALLRLLGDEHLRNRLGTAAREWVKGHASLTALSQHYDKLYREAMSGQLD